MKKFLYPALALSALALASCSSEEPVAGNGDSVTFNVTIPGSLSSRATLGDQILAPVDNLQWTVYEVNGETKTAVYTASFEGTPFANGKTTETVTLNLGKGKTYQVVFYADNAANGAVSFTNGVLSVDYDAMATNTLAEDAFVGTSEAVVAGDPTNTVQLIRPFAQLNWGTSDLNDPVVAKYINPAAGVTALTAQVTVTGTLFKSFDVISNTFSDEVTDATFGAVTAADFSAYETEDQKVTFPAVGGTETYSLLAMNYLMPGTQGTATCTLAFNNGFESVEVNSVTLKQNFRTNIYGALLTNPTEFNVQIAPAFEEGDNNYPLAGPWDGTTTEEPALNATTGNYEVNTPAQLAGLAKLVNENPDATANNTYVLLNDVDMGGKDWTPAGQGVRSGTTFTGTAFKGNFDGNGKTISNLALTDEMYTSSDGAIGLFGIVDGGTVKNFTIKSVKANVPSNELCGAAAGMLTNGGTVQGVTVESGSLTVNNGGGVVGRLVGSGTIADCSNGADVNGQKANLGGIVGAAYSRSGDMAIKNCTNTGKVTSTATNPVVGGIAGLCMADVTECINNGAVSGPIAAGGIVGTQSCTGTVSGCVNNGAVSTTSTDPNLGTSSSQEVGAGGIVSAISYWGSNQSMVVVTGNTNNGSVTSVTMPAGGIIGSIGHGAEITDNINNSSDIKGTYVAGIAGVWRGYAHTDKVAFSVVITGNKTVAPANQGTKATADFINWWANNPNVAGFTYTDSNNTVITK